MERVQPGEPLLPRLTASWYNSTLPSSRNNVRQNLLAGKIKVPAGMMYAEAITSFTASRYDPVKIYSTKNGDDEEEVIPVIQQADSEEFWGVTQEKITGPGTYLIAVTGVTFANVKTGFSTGDGTPVNRVTVDTTTHKLIAARRGIGRKLALLQSGELTPIAIEGHIAYHYAYKLLGGWTQLASGTYRANSRLMDKFTGDELTETALIHDTHGTFRDLIAGDYGTCVFQDGKFYAIQAPCSTSDSSS